MHGDSFLIWRFLFIKKGQDNLQTVNHYNFPINIFLPLFKAQREIWIRKSCVYSNLVKKGIQIRISFVTL